MRAAAAIKHEGRACCGARAGGRGRMHTQVRVSLRSERRLRHGAFKRVEGTSSVCECKRRSDRKRGSVPDGALMKRM